MDIDQPIVDRAVYYFTDSLESIPRPEDHSFFRDEPRAIMIFKWMRFYCYHPKLSKRIDKPRRDELKDHLNLPPGFGQRLGSFIINKFNTFKKWGLVYTVENGIGYHAATDTWLSRTWDGNIEQTRQSVSREKQSPSSGSIQQKRRAPSSTPERNKRQKTAIFLEVNTARSSSTSSGDYSVSQTPSLPLESRLVSVTSEVSRASQDIEKTEDMHGLTPECHQEDNLPTLTSTVFMNTVPRVSSTTVSDFNTTGANPSTDTNVDSFDTIGTGENDRTPRNLQIRHNSPLSKNSVPDHLDLAARLEELATVSADNGAHGITQEAARALPDKFQGDLVTLKDMERTCRQQLNESIQELEVSRSSYKHLLKEYQSLKSELETFALVLERPSRGGNPIISTTLARISEADVVKRLEDFRQKRDDTWLESKRAEKFELEEKMAAQSEDKARKKITVMEQKAKHSELRACIRDKQEEYAKDRKQKAKIEDLLSGFIDVESDSSGTVSPAESMSSDTEEYG